jgi:hypothetical protein
VACKELIDMPYTTGRIYIHTSIKLKSYIFLDITPCSPVKVIRRFGGAYGLHLADFLPDVLVSILAYPSTLKMETMRSSETLVDFHRTTRRYFREDATLHTSVCENFRSTKH